MKIKEQDVNNITRIYWIEQYCRRRREQMEKGEKGSDEQAEICSWRYSDTIVEDIISIQYAG